VKRTRIDRHIELIEIWQRFDLNGQHCLLERLRRMVGRVWREQAYVGRVRIVGG